MRFWKGVLPNITLVLSVAFVVLVYLTNRNPQPNFLSIGQFKYFAYVYAACSAATALQLYISWRKSTSKPGKFQKKAKNSEENPEKS